MLSTLLNLPVTIIHRDDSGDVDAYGNDEAVETSFETTGELQQQRRTEPGDQAETSDTTWLLILPAGTVIDTDDAVVVDGQVFELIGAPWPARNPRTQAESHVECTLRRVAGAETAS